MRCPRRRGADFATYSYHYVDRITKVDSNFPGEGLIAYDYSGRDTIPAALAGFADSLFGLARKAYRYWRV